MTNRPKDIGTAFETACARWLSERLGQRVERRALHGTMDEGDLGWLRSSTGLDGIVECKAGRQAEAAAPSDVAEWRRQTDAERENARAGFALLVLKTRNVGEARFGRTRCDLTVADLCRLVGREPTDESAEVWVSVDLDTACHLVGRGNGE